ncbi:MAG TPA: SHOCT domain-containing protein [Candidatus Wunengus sp. YC60]|uniref:SHOCT domain-containing protein n=1 Tax=Candidatus Wunengus sp. YC60 TaxID=3367697 RepID=UPI004028A4BD
MNNIRTILRFVFPLLSLVFLGCTTVRYYPTNFIESLKHPTKFPEVYSSTVKNIEEVAEKNPLGKDEEVKITDVSENKNSSMHLVQVRENGELHPHYHKRHDEVVYVKKGSGIATLDGTRYMVKPGSILQIPTKTVHKFLNTGSEPFVAVSIFSPPFDGRDEKRIKEKRKADRVKMEEKRLAMKKPEKVTEVKNVSVAKESGDREEKKPAFKPEKVSEKPVNEALQDELNTVEENEKTSVPARRSPTSEGKKKKAKKTSVPAEKPAINISDLHEKLTKLLELKEEGTISASEYEEKKDALIKGEDIGELPEPKAPTKKKTPIEEEPIVEKAEEEHIPADESITHEDQDAQLNTPALSGETEPSVHEVESEEKAPQSEDKLKMLEEMRQEGLITEEDYESKKSKLTGISEERPASVPSENTVEDKSEDERIKELKELYSEGLITEEDYKHKLNELSGANPQDLIPAPDKEEVENDKLSELNKLREEGVISEEDYEFKKAQLMDQ